MVVGNENLGSHSGEVGKTNGTNAAAIPTYINDFNVGMGENLVARIGWVFIDTTGIVKVIIDDDDLVFTSTMGISHKRQCDTKDKTEKILHGIELQFT